MSKPAVEPWILCVRLAPGEQRDAAVSVPRAPVSAEVSGFIAGAGPSIAVKRLVAFDVFERPLSEEEIAELPPFPPSIRERARATSRVEEQIEIASSDGSSPVSVSAGNALRVVLRFSAVGQSGGEVVSDTLTFGGSSWEPIDVPILLLTGQATHASALEPAEIRRAAEPRETVTQDALIASAPVAASVVSFIAKAQSIVRLTQMIAFRPFRKAFTEEEIEELPPYPASIRDEARKNGYIEYRELGRSDGLTPVAVSAGDMLRFYLTLSAPAENFPDFVETELVVEGTAWTRAAIPVQLIIGKIDVEISRNSLELRQGESGNLDVKLTSLAGPDTLVALAFSGDDEWRIEPAIVGVTKGATVSRSITIHVEDRARVGAFDGWLEARCFNGLKVYRLAFKMTVRPGLVTVRLQQSAISVIQGQTVTCQAEVKCFGGHKAITLAPTNPPAGVRMNSVLRHVSGKSASLVPFDLVIDALAPPGKGVLGVSWDAADGTHRAVLFLEVTVSLAPDSRTFHQPITTPSGTALGGWSELTIRTDGTYTFRGHMHGSGFDPYVFRINAVVRSSSGVICLAAQISGHVAGTVGPLGGSRDFDWNENGSNTLIPTNWADLRNGSSIFSKWYEDTGVLGTLEDIAEAVANFFVVQVFVGPLVAGAIVIGSELGATAEIPFLHPTVIAGVFAAGAMVLVLGPGVILPAIGVGIAAASAVKARPMRDSEANLAAQVFADTLPIGRILITNFDRDGRAFCVPSLDGSILVCMGSRYDDVMGSLESRTTLIHELTHAWQIAHNPAIELIWQAAINETKDQASVYAVPSFDGRAWSGFSSEQQGVIVASNWFYPSSSLPGGLQGEFALNSPWFRYIRDNIRLGAP